MRPAPAKRKLAMVKRKLAM